MPGRQNGQAGGVHNTQALNASDPRLSVEDSQAVAFRAHAAGAGGVEDGREAGLDVAPDVVVGDEVWAWEVLFADQQRLHGRGFPNLTGTLKGSDGNLPISWVTEPVGVDDRVVGRVVGLNGHVALR